jgi:hypothetical protein
MLACSPTRRLSENEYLLNKTRVELNSKEFETTSLKPYEKQVPNKTILGMKFHLALYNLFAPEKTKGLPGWFKKIGEEPVVWDPVLTERTTEQFKRYLETKGYYDARVSDSVYLHKNRAFITYDIDLNEPYRIRSIRYYFEDQNIASFMNADSLNCLIKAGSRFDKELLQKERLRIEEYMKNKGFYKFSKEYVFFEALEGNTEKQIDLIITIKENISGIPDPETKVKHHYQYKIDKAFIYPNFSFSSINKSSDIPENDTVSINNNFIVYTGKHRIKPDVALFPNQCSPGSIYRLDKVKKTYNNYSSLGLFRLINIQFEENDDYQSDTSSFKYLNCYLELSPRKIQSYQTEIVGTNSSGDLGARANLRYNNYNLFRGAERFEIRLTGAIERIKKGEDIETGQTMYEGGIESTLTLPKFLVPFRAEQFTRKYNPRTSISASYNYQNQPMRYIRTIANSSFSYRWKGNSYNAYQIYPVDINYVWLPQIDSSFYANEIEGTHLVSSFSNHTILASRATFEYTTQVIEKKEDFFFLRTSIEPAGNLLHFIDRHTANENDSTFLGVPYFQYIKCDLDFGIHDQITQGNKIVYRVLAGIGYPLGDQDAMPFEKMYSPGGPNDVRAWSYYELGPGSYSPDSANNEKRLGDIKLVANLEYRFKLFWVIEGALFVDAGNTWTVFDRPDQPGSTFKWNQFYKEFAVGGGFGTRFDFSFLMIRTDFGIKLRDPSIQDGSRWIGINQSRHYTFNERFTFQFGIGYPF